VTGRDERPNFFVLLELDPDAPWDSALFQRVLATARTQWAKDSTGIGSLPKVVDAKRNLGLVTQIKRVMENAAQRDAEREDAWRRQADAIAGRRRDLDGRLTLMLQRGYLLAEEVARIHAEFADVLAADPALGRRLQQAQVRTSQTAASAPRLSPTTEEQLRSLLRQARVTSVYEALKGVAEGITETSPLLQLLAAADKLYLDAHETKDKSDPAVKARDRLSGMAKIFFASAEERHRHDMSMMLERLRVLLDRFENVLAAARMVSAAQLETFLEDARREGVADLAMAKEYVVAHFTARGWAVELPAPQVEEALRRKVQCAYCADLNEPKDLACRTCGSALREPCPNCDAREPRYGGGCVCGFPIGQRNLVEDLIVQAGAALEAYDFAQAEVYLDRAARIWNLPPGHADKLATKLADTRLALRQARDRTKAAQGKIASLLADRRFVAAIRELRQAPEGLPRRSELLEQAEAAVRRARSLYVQARQPGTPREQQVALYTEALEVCADLEAARTELAGIRPDPPGSVHAQVVEAADGVLVTWRPSRDADVSYVVVRGTGDRAPASVENLPSQQRLHTTTATTWRDRSATGMPGVPLWYAVFTERSGTFSAPAAAGKQVVVAVDAEVSGRAEDGRVVLAWQVPDRAVRVEVTRVEVGGSGPPRLLHQTEPGRLVDTEVRNGVRYAYTVRTAYPRSDGGTHWSRGRVVEVTPATRPAPPGPLTVVGERPEFGFLHHRTQIRWPPAERGTVQVVRQVGAGSLRDGDHGPEAELHLTGHLLSGAPPVTDPWIDRITLCSYVPVLTLDGMRYVGPARRYALAPEPTDPQGEFTGGVVRLGWGWPEGCAEVLVGYDPDRPVLDPTAAPQQLTIGRFGDEPAGGCDLDATGAGRFHVCVAAVVVQDAVRFVTSGVPLRVDRPAARLQYEVRHAGRRRELVLHATGPVEVPRLMLRGCPGREPRTRTDGTQVAMVGPLRLEGRRAVDLPRSADPALTYRLFTAVPPDASAVQLDRR
jgi:hypothetical protein